MTTNYNPEQQSNKKSNNIDNIIKIQNFINGEFKNPSGDEWMDSFNPSTGQVCNLVPCSTSQDVDLAVESAQKAFQIWKSMTRNERVAYLNKIADLIERDLNEFALAESQDQGKPLSLAKTVDIPRAIHNFRFFASHQQHLSQKSTMLDGIVLNYIHRDPAGVAGLISPWNLPLYLLTWKIAPCLAAGCTCVCKPSEFTSLTAFKLCKVIQEAGVPAGVVNMVFGTGQAVGARLVAHRKVPLISFTGGTVTGEFVYANSAPNFKKLSLELGGKNANIIFKDCNLEKAVQTSIRSSFANQGEICLCGSRIFVQKEIKDTFLEAFIAEAKKLKVGDPLSPDTNMGALVSETHLKKVLGYVEIAKSEGGKVVFGGNKLNIKNMEKGYFMEPTIILSDDPYSRICQEEVFGPVVTVTTFDTDDQVIEYANSTKYGLSASIWTESLQRAHRVAHQLHVGTAWVNCWMVRDLNMPFGGVKASGLGREGGDYSMEFFYEEKTVCISLN